MSDAPHNFFEPSKDVVHPTPDPHQDEAAALAHADRSPASAFVAIALSGVGAGLLYFGRSLFLEALCLAAAGIVVAVVAWRQARRSQRPSGVAVGAVIIGLITVAVVVRLWT